MSDLMQRLQNALSDRYRIEHELGRGGTATVFLAEDLKHHRQVAIKVLDPEVAAAIGPERFLREIETVARLTHPNIMPLFDSGQADGLLFYAMPFVEGESLRRRLERERQLSVEEALRITREVADALNSAHSRGVIHRDIKPENILLEEGHAIVADFGVARAAAAGRENLTPTGVSVGTPAYMSPEQVTGGRDLDGRSDLYSLACVLYEMLAGMPPFAGPSAESLAHQHLNLEPRPITALRSSVPPHVAGALMRALAKARADRFATTAAFAAVCAPGGENGDQRATVLQPTARSMKSAGHHGRWIAAVAAGWVVAIVTVAILPRSGPYSGRLPKPSMDASAKRNWILVADFDSPPEDLSLARAAREIVSAALDQSPIVASVPRDQVQLGLQQAGKPDTARLTAPLAREIAYRNTVRTVIEGEIARLGDNFTVTLRVADVEDDKQVFTLTNVAHSENALIPVLTRMAARVREKLGESPRALGTTRDEEWSVATPSFEAYRRWAEGLRLYYDGDFEGALQRCRAALAADSAFGVAWASAGMCLIQLGKQDSAIVALEEALRRPKSLTPAYRLLTEGRVMWWRGDAQSALQTFDRVSRLYPRSPEAAFALNHKSLVLAEQGRLLEALEVIDRGSGLGPLGVSDVGHVHRASLLIGLGRFSEASAEARNLEGMSRQRTDLGLALAEGAWDRADSLATEFERDPRTGIALRIASAGARAQVAAVRGSVTAAEAALRRAATLQREKGRPALAPRLMRTGVLLSLASMRPTPRAEAWLERDTTSGALITRTYMAAATGETALARRTLAALRGRTATRLGLHGATPEFLEASIAAQSGRWSNVITLISGPARDGSDRGGTISDRIGVTPERWLVAQAYEKLGKPDSAAAFCLRLLGPDTQSRLLDSFARQRLVMLYARMGRLADAERHLAVLERDFTRPDPDMRHLLGDARAAVRSARGLAEPEELRR